MVAVGRRGAADGGAPALMSILAPEVNPVSLPEGCRLVRTPTDGRRQGKTYVSASTFVPDRAIWIGAPSGSRGLCGLAKAAHHGPRSQPKIVEARTSLVTSQPDTLRVPPQVIDSLGIKTTSARTAPPPAPLKLEGTLFLDPNRLTRVHTRFAGEVMEIGRVSGFPDDPEDRAMPVEPDPLWRSRDSIATVVRRLEQGSGRKEKRTD